MKFIIDNWMLISVAFVSGAMLLWPAVKGGAVRGLSAPAPSSSSTASGRWSSTCAGPMNSPPGT